MWCPRTTQQVAELRSQPRSVRVHLGYRSREKLCQHGRPERAGPTPLYCTDTDGLTPAQGCSSHTRSTRTPTPQRRVLRSRKAGPWSKIKGPHRCPPGKPPRTVFKAPTSPTGLLPQGRDMSLALSSYPVAMAVSVGVNMLKERSCPRHQVTGRKDRDPSQEHVPLWLPRQGSSSSELHD